MSNYAFSIESFFEVITTRFFKLFICHFTYPTNQFYTGPAIVIRAFPDSDFIFLHQRIIFCYTPQPFSIYFIKNMLLRKPPTVYRFFKIPFIAVYLPGVKKTDHALSLWPRMFFF